jgi:predicted DNA-binding transcriptional regulator YafY
VGNLASNRVTLSWGWRTFEVPIKTGTIISFVYRNHRNEVSERRARMIGVYFGSTRWHREPQWMMVAMDLDKHDERTFAMRDIMDVVIE